MKIFTWNDILETLNTGSDISFFDKGTGISTGSFDGLHKGHRLLLNTLVGQCRKNDLISGVVTFTRPLPGIKHAGDYQGDLSTLTQRINLLEKLGIEFVIIVKFDDSFASMLGVDYLNLLANVCNMKLLAEGVDFRCGYKGAVDGSAIKLYGQNTGIKTIFVDPVFYQAAADQEERVSSSCIRKMVSRGFFSTVEELLERKYEVELFSEAGSGGGPAENVEKVISKSDVVQVLPPVGLYHCKNEVGDEVRVEIQKDLIKMDKASRVIRF